MTGIGVGAGLHGEPAGFFLAGGGTVLAALGLEVVTQSLGSLRPSWWPEHIIQKP